MDYKKRYTGAVTDEVIFSKHAKPTKFSSRTPGKSLRKIVFNNASTAPLILTIYLEKTGGDKLVIVPSVKIPGQCGVVFKDGVAYDSTVWEMKMTVGSGSSYDYTIIAK